MKLRNKETGTETMYIEGNTEFNSEIWELVEGEITEEEYLNLENENDVDE